MLHRVTNIILLILGLDIESQNLLGRLTLVANLCQGTCIRVTLLPFSSGEAMGKGGTYGHWVLVENDAQEKSNY